MAKALEAQLSLFIFMVVLNYTIVPEFSECLQIESHGGFALSGPPQSWKHRAPTTRF
jgi:hypothetical protein